MKTMLSPTIKIKKLDHKAQLPSRNKNTDAGVDLRSTHTIELMPLSRGMVKTGLSIEIPESYYGRIAPRSGLALKRGIDVLAGVIDSSYRGELCIILYNTDPYESFTVHEGDRIAQLIIEKHYNFPFEEVDLLSQTERSNNGFGSSGIN